MEISGKPDPGLIPASDAVHENTWYNQDFDGYRITEDPLHTKRQLRVVCVGAGAAGLQIAYKAERLLENIDLQIYEKNGDIGGTWLENRYPAAHATSPVTHTSSLGLAIPTGALTIPPPKRSGSTSSLLPSNTTSKSMSSLTLLSKAPLGMKSQESGSLPS